MKKDNHVFLENMLESIENIEEYVKYTSSFTEFKIDNKTHDAVLRNFQIIGKAARNLNTDTLINAPIIEEPR